jgi:hypothetical protein
MEREDVGGTLMQRMFGNKTVFVVAMGLGVAFLCAFICEASDAVSPEPSASVLAKDDESIRDASSALAFLKGRWRRPDGGYVIDVKDVEATGKMDAAYFNPQPIRVSKAEVIREGGATTVFIELRDTGYPGCTYKLTYDPQTDQLKGVYFQAAIQQNFEVVFFRIK